MLLHLSYVMLGLIEGIHLKFVHNDAARMQLVDHRIQVWRVVRIGIFDHDQLAQFDVQAHARYIHPGELLILHIVNKMSE